MKENIEHDDLNKKLNQFYDCHHNIENYKYKLVQQISASSKLIEQMSDAVRQKIEPDLTSLLEVNLNIPNFLIIGAQKSATTWLYEVLKKHPQILLPKGKKEIEFFSYYQKRINTSGLLGYLRHFNQIHNVLMPQVNQYKAIGEATPSYFWSIYPQRMWTNPPKFFNDNIPRSVRNCLGDKTKLILCVRDPVKRAISAYLHHIRRQRISYQQHKILDIGHLYGIVDIGFYYQHLSNWLTQFDMRNFNILIYETQIQREKQKTIEEICDFLEVDYQLYPELIDIHDFHNKGMKYDFDIEKGVFINFKKTSDRVLVVSRDEIQRLKEIYYDDALAFQKSIGRDLSSWITLKDG